MRAIKLAVIACLTVALVGSSASSAVAEDEPKFEIGDIIEMDRLGKTEEAEVVGFTGTGWLKVNYLRKDDFFSSDTICPPHRAKLVRKAGEPAKPAEEPASAPKAAAPAETYTWTDTTGKFSTEASFVKIAGDDVELLKADGTSIKLPLAKLSADSQKQAKDLAAKAAMPAEPENPFATPSKAPPKSSASTSKTTSTRSSSTKEKEPEKEKEKRPKIEATKLPETVANWKSAAAVLLDSGSPKTNFVPDAETPIKAASQGILLTPVNKPEGASFMSKVSHVSRLLLAPKASYAVVVWTGGEESYSDAAKTELERLNLETGTNEGRVELPARGTHVIDVDPTGKRVLAKNEPRLGESSKRLDVFEWAGSEWKHLVSWNPSTSDKGFATARFIDADHVLTNDAGKLAVWNLHGVKALWALQGGSKCTPVLSPNRRYIAALVESGVVVLDAKTGKLQRRLESGTLYEPKFAFRPDGTMLASVDGNEVQMWDLPSGKWVQGFIAPHTSPGEAAWIKDNYLLRYGDSKHDASLLDLDRRVVLWKYSTPGSSAIYNGKMWFAESSNGNGTFAQADLPHAAAIAKSAELNPDQLLLIKPGMEVAINVEGKMPDDERASIRAALKQNLEGNKMKVVEKSALVLQAKVDNTTTVKYTNVNPGIGRSRLGAKVSGTVSSGTFELVFQDSGKTIWQTSSSRGTSSFSYSRHLSNFHTSKKAVPTVKYFAEANLPEYLAQQGADGTYGKSKIGVTGID